MVRYAALAGLYEVEKTIGTGGFAKVKVARHIATGEKVAIKIMEKAKLGDDIVRVDLEMKALKSFSHQHICKLYQVIETETHFFLVIEYCAGGELFEHIVEKNRLTETESQVLFRQIVSAVAYLHNLGYAHRDIKPENILLDCNQSLKLVDFGLCAQPKDGINTLLSTFCGSPTYAAPELILGKQYLGPEVDVWAMGVLLYALLAGYLPFDHDTIDGIYKKVLSGIYEEPEFFSQGSKNLIRSMIQVDPKNRITVKELLTHPWLNYDISRPIRVREDNCKRLDEDCVAIMAQYHQITPAEMWRYLKKWRYDYNTATYLLLMARKKRYLPLKINSSARKISIETRVLANRAVKKPLKEKAMNPPKGGAPKIVNTCVENSIRNEMENIPINSNVITCNSESSQHVYEKTGTKLQKSNKNHKAVEQRNLRNGLHDEVFKTPTTPDVMSPKNESRPMRTLKQRKRIRSPNTEGEYSPMLELLRQTRTSYYYHSNKQTIVKVSRDFKLTDPKQFQ